MKVKFFTEETITELEDKVNQFIRNKKVINISFAIEETYILSHRCVVLYEE